jgi:hypothetical protein
MLVCVSACILNDVKIFDVRKTGNIKLSILRKRNLKKV